jgi:PadR family transcriptional regulator PadR
VQSHHAARKRSIVGSSRVRQILSRIRHKSATPRKSLLEFLILEIVSTGRVYTVDILQRLSTADFATQDGTLYPLLSKMRREELPNYEWQESKAGPPRKYYRLTAGGRKQLAEFHEYWKSLTSLIDTLGKRP